MGGRRGNWRRRFSMKLKYRKTCRRGRGVPGLSRRIDGGQKAAAAVWRGGLGLVLHGAFFSIGRAGRLLWLPAARPGGRENQKWNFGRAGLERFPHPGAAAAGAGMAPAGIATAGRAAALCRIGRWAFFAQRRCSTNNRPIAATSPFTPGRTRAHWRDCWPIRCWWNRSPI